MQRKFNICLKIKKSCQTRTLRKAISVSFSRSDEELIANIIEEVVKPPGHLLLKLLQWFLSKNTFEKLVLQDIETCRVDIYESLNEKKTIRAKYFSIMLYIIVFKNIFSYFVSSGLVKMVRQIGKK
jgi:hypothetical protein